MDYLKGLGRDTSINVTSKEMAEDLKLGTSSTRRRLLKLLRQGIVTREILRTKRGQDLYAWRLTKPRRRSPRR